MKPRLLTISLLAVTLACAKANGTTSSTSSSSSTTATVNYQALASTAAVSITFEALSSDQSKTLLSDKTSSFENATAGRAFSGLVELAPGTYVFRARAFDQSGAELGEGMAENGAAITLTRGERTSISITIAAAQQPTSGPVITSFVASPTGPTVPVDAPVNLSATVAGGTGPLTYAWTENAACTHGVYSTPTNGLSATWSDSAEETCTLTFTATDPGTGLSDSRSVTIQCSCLDSSSGMALTACP